MLKNILRKIQQLENDIVTFSKTLPQKPSMFNKKETMVDGAKASKADVEKLNSMIHEEWDLSKELVTPTHKLKRGDKVEYLDKKANLIKTATVVSQGVYDGGYYKVGAEFCFWHPNKHDELVMHCSWTLSHLRRTMKHFLATGEVLPEQIIKLNEVAYFYYSVSDNTFYNSIFLYYLGIKAKLKQI